MKGRLITSRGWQLATANILAALFMLLGATSAQAASVHITGTVTDQSGQGVQNVSISATAPGSSTVSFGPSFTASDGSYQLDVDPGTYDIYFTPTSGGNFNPFVQRNF